MMKNKKVINVPTEYNEFWENKIKKYNSKEEMIKEAILSNDIDLLGDAFIESMKEGIIKNDVTYGILQKMIADGVDENEAIKIMISCWCNRVIKYD